MITHSSQSAPPIAPAGEVFILRWTLHVRPRFYILWAQMIEAQAAVLLIIIVFQCIYVHYFYSNKIFTVL
jgi:hypothetical protein